MLPLPFKQSDSFYAMAQGRDLQDPKAQPTEVAARLLAWYDRHARVLPWRVGPAEQRNGERPDPYAVWLSEIMLQQTTVVTVTPYFQSFLALWPTVDALAAAPLDKVLTAWAGLGYYARARNLHACAQRVSEELGGRFPEDETALRALPGVGPYTAAAVAAIAFDRPAAVVDGNVERVVARLFAIEQPLPDAKPELRLRAAELTPTERPGDYAQAMMDLGATVCLPRGPKCLLCPLKQLCRSQGTGLAESLPRKRAKPAKPTRRAVAFWLTRPDGAVLLRRRPEKGLLGGMMEVPSTDWRSEAWSAEEARGQAPLPLDWQPLPGRVRHVFTHFNFEIEVWAGYLSDPRIAPDSGRWVLPDALGTQALPTVMVKIARHALKHLA